MIHNLSQTNSIFSQFISEIRNIEVQKDSMRFRRNMERIGEVLAYEISKTLVYNTVDIQTPLGISKTELIAQQPVVASILRAGLPLHQGLLNYFDKAENAFISAYRKHHKSGKFEIHVDYLASPSIQDKVLILSDPMLATGASMIEVYKALKKHGLPSKVIVVVVIASKEALDRLVEFMPSNTEFYIGAVDSELTAQSYIVPGLGDAGDLAFGAKQ